MNEKRILLLMLAALALQMVFADDGGDWFNEDYRHGVPNYSMGAQVLKKMNDKWIEPIKYSVVGIIYTIAALMVMYSGTVIYIKLQTGDEGFMKSATMLVGAVLFLFTSVEVIPGFFGEHGENVIMYTDSLEVFDPSRRMIESYIMPIRRVILVIGALVAVGGSIRIYWKMNNQDQDIKQSIYILVMSCLFLLLVVLSLPAFFGFRASSVPLW